MQLFFLHFAGGNCYSYEFLIEKVRKKATSKIDCFALELPGRGKRLDDAFLVDKNDAITDYVSQIKNLRNNEPYIIYGHSMGAILGFSVVKKMEELNDPPIQFIATGNPGPGIKMSRKELYPGEKRYLLNDEKFKRVLKKLGGFPEQLLVNEEFYQFFSPIIRADYKVLEEGKEIDNDTIIHTPILALMGDSESNSNQINNWKKYTTSTFEAQTLIGNHFFIKDHPDLITQLILKCCKQKSLSNS